MPERLGKYTISLTNSPHVIGYAAVVGKKEGEGPLGDGFDYIYEDASAGQKSWEKAESLMHTDAVNRALSKAGVTSGEVDVAFAGDLLNQCTGSSFALRDSNIPFVGLYGACSTMALSLACACVSVDAGIAKTALASTSSHFCSAEKQFRMPLEYGGQRTPTAQWTATAAGAAVISNKASSVKADKVIIGRICDYGVKDPNNFGAAMAPAAASTIAAFLADTETRPEDYDMILTGDLGCVGTDLLRELTVKEYNTDIAAVHRDCGLMIFDTKKQKDTDAGGSGCGCSAAVLCSEILGKLSRGELKRVFFVGTGALMSSVSSLQSESIPSIAHGVLLEHTKQRGC